MELPETTIEQIRRLCKHYSSVVEDWTREDIVILAILSLYEDTFPIHIRIR